MSVSALARRPSSLALLSALVVGTFFTAEEVFMDLARSRADLAVQDVVNGAEFWVVWAALAPVAMAVIRRWPVMAQPIWRPTLVNAIAAVSLSALHGLVVPLLDRGLFALDPNRAAIHTAVGFVWGLFTGVVFYTMMLMVDTAVRFRGLYISQQLSAAALETELSRSRLETLRSQLRPHFLFNTLNAISVFVAEDAATAQRLLLRLSSLLRRSLDEESHEVPLERELTFLRDYLEIQQGRFGDQLAVSLNVDPSVADVRVPVFLLQPMFENAIEHGKVEGRPVSVVLDATRDGDTLRLAIVDDGPGPNGHGDFEEGVGLRNTRARLLHLYGQRASVQIGAVNPMGGGTRVEIALPLERARS